MISREEFEDLVTDTYGTFKIFGMEFPAGKVLRECDPIAFNVELANYRSEIEEEEDTPDPYIAYVGEKPTAKELAEIEEETFLDINRTGGRW